MDKSLARKNALEARNSLDIETAEKLSDVIIRRFLELFSGYDSFLLYSSIRSEVRTQELINILYGMKKTVYLPRVVGDEIEPGLYDGQNSLVKGAFGVLEPSVSSHPASIDVAAVPAAAFDEKCTRVGYGKGYYDRLLKKDRIRAVAGLAYECQKTDVIDAEAHDIPCDLFISEKYIYRRNS